MLWDPSLIQQAGRTAAGSHCYAQYTSHPRHGDLHDERYCMVQIPGKKVSMSRLLCTMSHGAPVFDLNNAGGYEFNRIWTILMNGGLGNISQRLEVCHKCNRKNCLNPHHMTWGYRVLNANHHWIDKHFIAAQDLRALAAKFIA